MPAHDAGQDGRRRIAFIYLGRRGALSRLTLDLAQAAEAEPGPGPLFILSRQNEQYAQFASQVERLAGIDTFSSGHGAVTQAWRVPAHASVLVEKLKTERVEAAVTLLSHVWTPLIVPYLRRSGIAHATIVHDWAPHPGDPTALVNRWLLHHLPKDDAVITLSRNVADALRRQGRMAHLPIHALFHPNLSHGVGSHTQRPAFAQPFRLLFLGRILAYKGLGLLIDAVTLARARGAQVQLSVYGEGPLGVLSGRLTALGVDVVNRWLSDAEIAAALAQHHAVVLSHTEASQSGVAGAAFGAGAPVIATPVGGLLEQVVDGETGLIAAGCHADALADALVRLAGDAKLYDRLVAGVAKNAPRLSMANFLRELLRVAAEMRHQ